MRSLRGIEIGDIRGALPDMAGESRNGTQLVLLTKATFHLANTSCVPVSILKRIIPPGAMRAVHGMA